MNTELLNNFREQIDWIDREILYLLFRRFTLVNEIWKIKKELWMSPLQKDRWQEVLNNKIEVWKEYWLKKEFIEDIWNRIHKEALEIEK
jgi:chorismate mutase